MIPRGVEMTNQKIDPDGACLRSPEQWASFLSAFVHELRTPLASVRMLAELLAEGQFGTAEKRYTDNLQEAVLDLQSLIGDVAELTRLSAGRVKVRVEEVIPRTLAAQVQEAVRPQAWERGIAVTESLDPALLPLRTDPERLRRAITLLLTAAVGHAASEVFFRLDAGEDSFRVVISSDGATFPEAALETPCEPFNDGLRIAHRRGGRSLSLPLACELTRALGGSLKTSNRGGRPTFELSLPTANPERTLRAEEAVDHP